MHKERKTRTIVAAAVIASLFAPPVSLMLAAQEVKAGSYWNMTYHAGAAPIRAESQISVTIEGNEISLRVRKGPEFVIPLDEVTAVSSNVIGHHGRVSLGELKFAGSVLATPNGCGSGEAAYGCAAVVLGALLLVVPSYPIKTTERLVRIVWRDKSTDEEIILKLHKSDYQPFLGQLEKATAKPWKNLDVEWGKVQEELKREEPNKIEIQLDRKVRIAQSDLEAGTYQIVLLEREANRGELYFFPGNDISAEHLAAVAPVEVAQRPNQGPVKIEYKQGAKPSTAISTIYIASKELRFP